MPYSYGGLTLTASATDMERLTAIGLSDAAAFIAVTDHDCVNICAAQIAKKMFQNIKKKMIPDRTVTFTYYCKGTEKELLDRTQVEEASTYAQTYLLVYVVGTIALTFFSGCTLLEGAFEFASSLGTVGLSIGVTNAGTTSVSLLIEIIVILSILVDTFISKISLPM
ncbi:MAG: NAD-binding protein, partial [Bacillus sp. (in: firmicutes)]